MALVAAALLVGSLVPVRDGSVPTGGGGVSLFGLLHVLGYAVLSGTLAVALAGKDRADWQVLVVAVLGTVAYGGAIEVLQGPLAHRTFSHRDLLSNTAGAVAAGLSWWAFARLLPTVQTAE